MTTDTELQTRQLSPIELRYNGYDEGVHLTGIQAIVRAIAERRRTDIRAGLHTAGFISGYPGSPLGGLDVEIDRQHELLEPLAVVHQHGVNEELAATAVFGSQLVEGRPEAEVDGVTGWWYGKAPGLDRAADALRHANYAGTGAHSGAVVLVGDDPSSKSSTLPCASEHTLQDLALPVLFPGSVADVLELAHHAVELSRMTGVWVALKIVTDVADGSETVFVPKFGPPTAPTGSETITYTPRADGHLLPPYTIDAEKTLHTTRLAAVRAYLRVNGINRVTVRGDNDWLGVVAAGKTYHNLLQGLRDSGLHEDELREAGIRLLELRAPWPLHPEQIREFADGLDRVLVVEEKRAFVEPEISRALYPMANRPQLLGKNDLDGLPLVPEYGVLDAAQLARYVLDQAHERGVLARVQAHRPGLLGKNLNLAVVPSRTPYFCSGCPHNRSTQVPEGQLVGAGIGCHLMVAGMDERFGEITGNTVMGGEGAQWVGMSPFLRPVPFTQNVGDGTFFHSGQLALRQAVASGATVTYKLLFNDAIAMTGGGAPAGTMAVPELTRLLELEGVKRTIVTTEDLSRYKRVKLAKNASVWHRDKLERAQQELGEIAGVTVLIHDQECTAQKRRRLRRTRSAKPEPVIVINERVCEGCGDCSVQSNCLSLRPVDTPFGQKTQIHQSSCNKDLSCIRGNCPSFVTVTPKQHPARPAATRASTPPPTTEPSRRSIGPKDTYAIRMTGIGGTGVVTVNQVLATAALLDGLKTSALDQTGTAQKGGPVISDVIIGHQVPDGNKVSHSRCDALLAFDAVVALAPATLATLDANHTRAVINTDVTPTGQMASSPHAALDGIADFEQQVRRLLPAERAHYVAASQISEYLLRNHVLTNVVLLGAAYQRGLIPISSAAIRNAFELNGSAVAANLTAFEWGRATVEHPQMVAETVADRRKEQQVIDRRADRIRRKVTVSEQLPPIVADLATDLVEFHSARVAASFVGFLERVQQAESARLPGNQTFTTTVARYLHKLTAYKDEYEVARLHLTGLAAVVETAGGTPARVAWNLHPPILKSVGVDHKIQFGAWFTPGFRTLYALRRLRGTALDPFGRDRVRKTERSLIDEYRAIVTELVDVLDENTLDTCIRVASLPDMVRGYDDVKLANVERYHAELDRELAALRSARSNNNEDVESLLLTAAREEDGGH
ncbi:indolepyruvate ferredoxin oxidoreductase family protein [Rhodococcus sp. IEGM 1351]|uniref:indolepyruvate ferredoxin oxidoreductase family protein n=1 Tax=Rhodococcus sp. IEGM 1351 TaxID=3047089 RepID=UPI0024B7D8BA|nr:indolepyruvate ferredoxin oxidoreductase family protein [Rhodococcus sp. IEGM 1351]MDI9941064.1 indolepyruvate ferredoxin oxidoreductase family protein [Rhodococcus sp. IEGM 1351]